MVQHEPDSSTIVSTGTIRADDQHHQMSNDSFCFLFFVLCVCVCVRVVPFVLFKVGFSLYLSILVEDMVFSYVIDEGEGDNDIEDKPID